MRRSEKVGRILLVGNYRPDKQRSMLRFEDELRRGLEATGANVRVVRPPQLLGGRRVFLHRWLKYFDMYILGSLVVFWAARRADLVHVVDHSNAVYRWVVSAPCVVTCHDLLAVRSARGDFSENRVGRTGRIQQYLIAAGLKRADHIVCVSAVTQRDVMSTLGVHGDRSSIAPVCIADSFGRPASRAVSQQRKPAVGPDRPFWIHVGSDAWYKNRREVVEIFGELRRAGSSGSLLLVGPPPDPTLADVVADQEVAPFVDLLDGVTDEQLNELYGRALGLLFPSIAEGFGWPVIEAQAAGCPVFASSIDILSEVGGADCALVTLGDPTGSAKKILTALDERTAIVERGRANARRFTRERMIDQYLAVYDRLRAVPSTASPREHR